MFTKPKQTGQAQIRTYKKVIDWDAVFGAIFILGVVVVVLANLG